MLNISLKTMLNTSLKNRLKASEHISESNKMPVKCQSRSQCLEQSSSSNTATAQAETQLSKLSQICCKAAAAVLLHG
jgi:hypothetical protein